MGEFDPENSASWEDFQEKFQTLLACFSGLEHVLISQYGLKPGDWQRNFSLFLGCFDAAGGEAVDHMQTQEGLRDMYLEHIHSIEPADETSAL